MGVQRFVQPDYSDSAQDGTTYAVNHDRAVTVFKRSGDWFAPHQVYTGSPNPDLAVELDAGWIWNGTTLTEVAAQFLGGFTIPTAGQHRVDRVVVDSVTGAASRVAGTAATGSPSATAPAIPAGKIPVCQVLITSADTAVLNSMITDERALVTTAANGAANLGTSAMNGFSSFINGTLVHTRGSNAETISVKTLAGADPSSGDPVYVVFRSATAATGDYTVITLTAATSITINSTATMGATSGIPFRLWVVGFNDAGTFRLGVINCLSGTSIYPLAGWGLASSTTMGTGADNAHVFYTGTGVTTKAYTVLGYSSWESGLATAGTWGTAPTRVQIYGAGVPLPGMLVQYQRTESGTSATGTTVMPFDNTIPQITEGDQYQTQAITPTSTANLLEIESLGYGSSSAGAVNGAALFQDATAGALMAEVTICAADTPAMYRLLHTMLAATTSATTFRTRIGPNTAGTYTWLGSAGARIYGGAGKGVMTAKEIMA